MGTLVHAAEGVWEQFQKGLISKRTWGGWERGISGILRARIVHTWWSARIAPLSAEFYDCIEHQVLENNDYQMPSAQKWMAASGKSSDNQESAIDHTSKTKRNRVSIR